MKNTDTRLTSAIKGIKLHHEAIKQATLSITSIFKSFQMAFASLTSTMFNQIEHALTLEHNIEEYRLGILDILTATTTYPFPNS